MIAIFQPHHQNRTRKLLTEFVKSFDLADQILITEIYRVSGRETEEKISGIDIASRITNKQVYFEPTADRIKSRLRDLNPADSILLFIGAGGIDNLARELVK